MTEYLTFADKFNLDEDDIEDYKDEIKAYLKDTKRLTEHSKYVERIDALLKQV